MNMNMSAIKIGSTWHVQFRHPGGRFRKKSPENSRAGALAFEATLRGRLARGESIDPSTSKKNVSQTLSSFANKWLTLYVDVNNKHSEQKTKRRVLKADLLPFFGKIPLEKISASDIEIYKQKSLAKGQSPKTVNNSLAILRKCLVTAIDWEELEHLPRIKLLKTVPTKFKYLVPEDLEKLLKVNYLQPWPTMIRTAARTGLRYSELLALEWENVDLLEKILCVRKARVMEITGTPKNGKIRYIPLTEDVVDALMKLPRKGPLVFHLEKKLINYSTGRFVITRMCEIAGIQIVGWHALRHTFASHLVSKGAPLKAVQDLLGHSTINMTLRYSHLNQEDLRNAIALLEPPRNMNWTKGGQKPNPTPVPMFNLEKILCEESPL